MAQGHPRARPIGPHYVEEMELEASLDFYRDRFDGAAGFTFVFVGDFELETMRPLVERYLASLPRRGRPGGVAGRRGALLPGGSSGRPCGRGWSPSPLPRSSSPGRWDHTARNRDLLNALAVPWRFRLREILREDLGGTYNVSVSGTGVAGALPWNTRWPSASGRLRIGREELVEAVTREIVRMQEEGPFVGGPGER